MACRDERPITPDDVFATNHRRLGQLEGTMVLTQS